MENKIERLKVFLKNSKTPIYMNENIEIQGLLSLKIKANCTEQELFDVEKEISRAQPALIQIDLNGSTKDEQKRFISLIKDKTIGTCCLSDNTRIIVYSKSKKNVDDELLGLMVVV